MHRLLAADRSLAAIAAEHSMSRNTVRRFARSADHGEPLAHNWTSCSASICTTMSVPAERWNSDCTNAAGLWQEIPNS